MYFKIIKSNLTQLLERFSGPIKLHPSAVKLSVPLYKKDSPKRVDVKVGTICNIPFLT
jgi:hypothetical protein